MKKLTADRILGLLSVLIGAICIVEGIRVYPTSNSLLSGDHAMLWITGGFLVILGLLLILFLGNKSARAEYPERPVLMRLVSIMLMVLIYTVLLRYLGYLASTALCGIVLFRLFGNYTWLKCVAISILTTLFLYLLFVRGLGMTFPRGILL